jgi:hypothetical protein
VKEGCGLGATRVYKEPEILIDAYWYCGSSSLALTLKKFASVSS